MKPYFSSVTLSAIVGFLSATVTDGISYLFITSPSTSQIHTARMLSSEEHSRNAKMTAVHLGNTDVVREPVGIAIDSTRKVLFMVDANSHYSGLGSGKPKLYAARIWIERFSGRLGIDRPVKLADHLSSMWVTVNYHGMAFFVANGQIMSIPEPVIREKIEAAAWADANATEHLDKRYKQVYDGTVVGVSMPNALAADGYRLFWANNENGKADGSIVQGLEDPPQVMGPMGLVSDTKVTPLATNLDQTIGVCLATSRIYYTDDEQNVYSTKLNGGPATLITDKLQKPRGCVFDSDGTVYVADNGGDRIVSFSGAAEKIRARKIMLAVDGVVAPFGVAVFHGPPGTPFGYSAAAPLRSVALIFSAAISLLHLTA